MVRTTTGKAATAGLDYGGLFASRAERLVGGSMIDSSTSLLQRQTHDVIRLAMGSPASESIPAEAFLDLIPEVVADPVGSFDYAPTEGEFALREALLATLSEHRSAARDEELIITSGGMQGLDLVAKLFIEPGDVVAVESPTYANGALTLRGYEADLIEIEVDGDGMRIDELAAEIGQSGRPPKLVYVIPNFQNPTGTTLSLERRRRLLELAERWGSIILEDDPYGWLGFSGYELPSLRTLAEGRVRVVGVHTFSKILAPGLRVGWTIAEPEVIERMIDARQAMDTCTNTLQQRLVERFLSRGLLESHLAALRSRYRERKLAMQAALTESLSDVGVTWTDPEGGFFLWLTLPDGIDASELFPAAVAAGVAFVPGAVFSPTGRHPNALRLAFSAEVPERADEGIRRLADVIRTAASRSAPNGHEVGVR